MDPSATTLNFNHLSSSEIKHYALFSSEVFEEGMHEEGWLF
jgi:hypothetical protein